MHMAVAPTLVRALKRFEGDFTPLLLTDVEDRGRDKKEENYRRGADHIKTCVRFSGFPNGLRPFRIK